MKVRKRIKRRNKKRQNNIDKGRKEVRKGKEKEHSRIKKNLCYKIQFLKI